MSEPNPSRWRSLVDRLGRLSPPILALVGIVVLAAFSGGGYFAFRTYDYVQHDNDFCMSCHLMEEPFERFAQSAHQGLGCKSCHRPNIVQRSQMGLTAVVENPDELSVHAEVPNETCAECHIDGDPEKWRVIANSAGHLVHLNSPELEGLQCVECHSTSIHEFSPIDRTCASAGCHEDNEIRLGAMSDLTVHCAACHTFVAPVPDEPADLASVADAAMRPGGDECFSCHVMRTLAAMPDPDPHRGDCAACHNPHEQTDPAQAAESCASAGCHADVATLTAFHRQPDGTPTSDCLSCHRAHDFTVEAACASCHEPGEPTPTGDPQEFDHERHASIACVRCHSGGDTHGAVSLTGLDDCRSCHHTEPVATPCADCHEANELPAETYHVTRAMTFSVGGGDPARELDFPHAAHVGQSCATCHTEGPALAVPDDLDCRSCHEDHHTPISDCAACHRPAPVEAHPPSEVHVTCSGAGCHTEVPFEGLPRTREFCLGCHQDLRDHEPGRRCVDCHELPPPRGGA